MISGVGYNVVVVTDRRDEHDCYARSEQEAGRITVAITLAHGSIRWFNA